MGSHSLSLLLSPTFINWDRGAPTFPCLVGEKDGMTLRPESSNVTIAKRDGPAHGKGGRDPPELEPLSTSPMVMLGNLS